MRAGERKVPCKIVRKATNELESSSQFKRQTQYDREYRVIVGVGNFVDIMTLELFRKEGILNEMKNVNRMILYWTKHSCFMPQNRCHSGSWILPLTI